jgi:hypothetical protein
MRIQVKPAKKFAHPHNIISQDAVNFSTNDVLTNSPEACAHLKLQLKTSIDLQQITMPMVHPTTVETITSYKRLMHDPDTAEIWQTAFGKEFGGMAQGDNKTGQKGTNSIFVMTHIEIPLIPRGQTVTYARVVVKYHPQKADPHCI